MDTVKAVEDVLGDIDTWPSYVIYNMSLIETNAITVKKVASFRCRNAAHVISALNYFNACMELDSSSSYVSSAMKKWYYTCDKNSYIPHKAENYSMSSKQWLWINGDALYQYEAVWPEIKVMQFGIESTGCQQIIKLTIRHIRSISPNCHAK